MGVSLYRKYRPQNFGSVVGQKAAVSVITNSIIKSRVGHAYLFSGPRGCGKTSVARIFAKALNCLEPENYEPCCKCKNCVAITAGENLDVIEIDGASNNSVDEVRELKTHVTLAPFSSKYKIFIIDEVHMLSTAAFNALLKTLEEPPEYVIFILATTEPHKVPVTIRSRCQHIPFHSISAEDIFQRLNEICNLENIKSENEALWEISRQADGALRDALSLLEQVISSGDVILSNVENILGAGSRPAFERLIVLLRSNFEEAYSNLKSMFDSGASSTRIFEEMFIIIKNLWLVSKWPNIADSLGISEQEKSFLQNEVKNWNSEKLHEILSLIIKMLTKAKTGIKSDILLGIFMLNIENEKKYINEKKEIKFDVKNESLKYNENIKESPLILKSNNENIVVKKENKENIDINLKEKILNAAHEKNFLIFCSIFDASPIEQNGNLILDFSHAYNYEVLKIARNSAALINIFENYKNIILQYKLENFVCSGNDTEKKIEISELIPEPKDDENKNKKEINKITAFSNILRELSLLQVNNEIIFTRRKNENASDNENNDESDNNENGGNETE